jgi:hypothetical protein
MLFRTVSAAACMLCLAVAPAVADPTTDAMKKAQAFYNKGELGKAYKQLEAAAGEISFRLAKQYSATYPAAPNGWTLPPDNTLEKRVKRQLGRGILLIRHYRQTGGKGIATAQLIADDRGIVAALVESLNNPATVKRMKGEWVEIPGGGKAIVEFYPARNWGTIRLLVSRRFYITITARHIEGKSFLVNLLSAWDFAALKTASGAK